MTDAELAGEVSAEELQALKHRVELLVRRKGGLPHARKEVTGLEGGGHVGGGGYGEEERSVDTNVNGGGQDDRGEVGGGGKVSSDETLPLPEGVLATSETLTTLFPALKSCSVGLPVPVTVVATNSEALDRLTPAVEKALFHGIRTFCMALGAGLVVLGDKGVGAGAGGRGGGERETDGEESLIGCMRGYLQYLLFGGRLAPPAQVIERTRTFIPAGWDTGPRINLLSPPPSGSLAELVSGAGGGGIGGGGGGDTGKDDVRPRPLIVADDQMLKLEIQEALSKDPAALKDAAALGLPSRTPRPAVATSTKNSTSAHTPRTPASSSARGTGDDCAVAGEAERGGGGVGGTPGGKELRRCVTYVCVCVCVCVCDIINNIIYITHVCVCVYLCIYVCMYRSPPPPPPLSASLFPTRSESSFLFFVFLSYLPPPPCEFSCSS